MESFAEHYGAMYQTVNRCLPGVDMTMIDKAVEYAQEKHKDQKRKDGSPYQFSRRVRHRHLLKQ